MRILYLTGGGSIHDYRFLTKLVEKGYQVYYIYIYPEGKKYEVRGAKSFCLGCDPLIPKGSSSKLIGKAATRIWAYPRFKKLLTCIKPDILHAGWILSEGVWAAVSGFHPFLLMPWGSDILLLPQQSLFRRKLAQYVIKQADMITCDAETVKHRIIELTDYPEEKIVVFPWGIDLKLFHFSEKSRIKVRQELDWKRQKVIIMTRNFEPIYGIEYFLRALPYVFKKIPEARAVLIGSGPLKPHLQRIAQELQVLNRVLFLGKLPNTELPRYLNAADLYVSSSLSDGTSLSLLEAMACGLPVVVTKIAAILEWVRDEINGLVVSCKDYAQLAEKIIFLLENEELAQKMKERNLAIAKERADWNKNFEKLEMIYATLAGNRKSR